MLIQFADTGPGISPSIREKLFEPFVSAGKKNGLGLGLALSRQTVLDHGGEIWVESNSPGARFIIRLPLKRVIVAQADSLPAPLRSPAKDSDPALTIRRSDHP